MAAKPAKSSAKKSTISKPKAKISTVSSSKKPITKLVSNVKSVFVKMRKMPLIAAVLAEFIGTFLLVSGIFAVQGQPLYVAFVLIGIFLIIGGTSGAYVNPAMTIGAWVTGKIKSVRAVCLILAEVFGAVVAWLVLNAFLNGSVETASLVGQKLFHAATITSGKEWIFFFAELLGALVLSLGIAAAIRIKRSNLKAAFSYGMAILIALLIAGWVTSMSLVESNTALTFLNPAVAIAANAMSWNIWPIAIYFIAPILGGIVGFTLYEMMKPTTDDCDCDC